jgi:hypothetical protein
VVGSVGDADERARRAAFFDKKFAEENAKKKAMRAAAENA